MKASSEPFVSSFLSLFVAIEMRKIQMLMEMSVWVNKDFKMKDENRGWRELKVA